MAESPLKITRSDDGLSVRCEFDARYVSDEVVQRIRGYIDQLEAENAKLQDENARLRSRLSDEFAENARMVGENAKLRELVAESDEDLYLDIAQGLFDDLMAVDEYKAEAWARVWPELFGEENDGCDLV